MEIKLWKTFSLILIFIFHSLFFAQKITHSKEDLKRSDSTSIDIGNEVSFNKFTNKQIDFAPVRETKDLLKLFPGLTTYQDQFHLRGSRSDEIAYTINSAPITDLFNGEQLLYIPLNIIDEVELFSGSQPITIGNSGSGIIEYKLKSGGDKLEFDFEQTSDNMGFNSRSNAYSGNKRLGAYWYGYSESNLSVGGPIFDTPIRFYVNGNYKFMRDKNPQRYPGVDNLLLSNSDYYSDPFYHDSLLINYPAGIVYSNSIEKYNIYGALDFDFDLLKIKLMGIYDNQLQDVSRNHIQNFLNSRIGKNEEENIFLSVSASHKLSSMLSYNFQANYSSTFEETYDSYLKDDFWAYGDSVANAEAGIFWERSDIERSIFANLSPNDTRYIAPQYYNFYGFPFQNDGTPSVNYSKSNQEQFTVKGNFNFNIFDNNKMKIGGGFTQGILRKWETLSNQSYFAGRLARAMTTEPQGTEEDLKAIILSYSGINVYGYNYLGEKTNEGYNAPHKPTFANIYFQDIITYNYFLIELGLRYDFYSNDYLLFRDPNEFYKSYNYDENDDNIFASDGFVKSQSYSYFNPHIIVKYKPTPKTFLQTSIQQTVKQSKFHDTYDSPYLYYHSGYDIFTYREGFGYNNDIKPTITLQVSQSFAHIISNQLTFNIEAFYKKIKNQPIVKLIETDRESTMGTYPKVINDGNSEIMGIDFNLKIMNLLGFSVLSNLSYITTKGSIQRNLPSGKNRPYNYVEAKLDFEKKITSNLYVSYNFSQLNKSSSILSNLDLTALLTYNSGHPYTLSSGGRGLETDLRYRTPVKNMINQQTTPNNFQVNLRLDKTIELYNKMNLNFYIYAINIFNNENVLDVFLRTGSPKTDGYLNDQDLGGKLVEQYGQIYTTLYNLINIQYNPRRDQQNMYGEPRQIIMGIKLNL